MKTIVKTVLLKKRAAKENIYFVGYVDQKGFMTLLDVNNGSRILFYDEFLGVHAYDSFYSPKHSYSIVLFTPYYSYSCSHSQHFAYDIHKGDDAIRHYYIKAIDDFEGELMPWQIVPDLTEEQYVSNIQNAFKSRMEAYYSAVRKSVSAYKKEILYVDQKICEIISNIASLGLLPNIKSIVQDVKRKKDFWFVGYAFYNLSHGENVPQDILDMLRPYTLCCGLDTLSSA